ncbi:3,4-dioxygenase subunit beta [Nocardioides sp. ChNu-153]|uniref:3,4-dioxygenase subunit beta n=1 Tax=unclassified Nocardioides TaxID=2615069 RepID=UPI0024076FC9|nr:MULTISPECIES: 3,4-dioxygenase subunit beta [unclassified Nocardioides]MDF9715514.1 3,4-dioxygenase subunit beta [Nocardioides sp. ChNu-99]MDN7120731.1 3,4-dioxygenase subunit beta [Nocardioides sp. ChNu-153]
MTPAPHGPHDHDEHREGLAHDLPVMQDAGMVGRRMARRGVLGLLGGISAVALVGCGGEAATSGSSASGAASSAAGAGTAGGPGGAPPAGGAGGGGGGVSQEGLDDGDIPEETNGPYPADGSNGVNVLTASGIVREDITTSFGDASGVAEGVPLRIELTVYDNGADGITPYEGAAVYLWHCDRDGNYSLYSSGIEGENYLRGVQVAAADGSLAFTSIFPATYAGRWPHLHFEVYPTVDDATSASGKLRTSQIAFPADVCEEVYGTAEGYESSVRNFAEVSLDTDNVFSDGHSLQMATLTGSVDEGYVLRLNVPV